MEIQIEKGVGYVQEKERKKEKLGVGIILLDAIFTPIKRVAFRVENMRVGERTDFDRLFLEIKTDGTISPEEAFSRASDILVQHFDSFSQTFEFKEKVLISEDKKEKVASKKAVKKPRVKKKSSTKSKKDEKKKKRKKT